MLTIFNFIKKTYTFSFIKWLLKYSNTEINLHKKYAIWNYHTTCFNEYLKNYHKYYTNGLITKNENKFNTSNSFRYDIDKEIKNSCINKPLNNRKKIY